MDTMEGVFVRRNLNAKRLLSASGLVCQLRRRNLLTQVAQ